MTGRDAHRRFRDWIDRDALGRLPARKRDRLHDHLRACPRCRGYHDLVAIGFGVLEGEPAVSRFELDQAERWVREVLPAGGARRRWAWAAALPLLAAVGAVAVIALRPRPPGPTPAPPAHRMMLTAKGAAAGAALAVEVFCGPDATALRPAAPGGCALSETLAFAYRAEPGAGVRYLSLFGVDDSGRALYYAPTPVDPAPIDIEAGARRPAPVAVHLGVNHRGGRLQVVAVATDRPPTVAAVDAWAAALAAGAPATQLCETRDFCRSAELTLTLNEDEP